MVDSSPRIGSHEMKKTSAATILSAVALLYLWQRKTRPSTTCRRPGHVSDDKELEGRQDQQLIGRLNSLLTEVQTADDLDIAFGPGANFDPTKDTTHVRSTVPIVALSPTFDRCLRDAGA